MTKRLLVMVGRIESGEIPWKRATRHEAEFVVSGKGKQDEVIVEVEREASGPHDLIAIPLHEGYNPVESCRWLRYRVHKKAGENPLPTMVEVKYSA